MQPDLVPVIALAIGLAMDATAVAATRGLRPRRGEAALLAVLFGGFQAGMAALGWLLGKAGSSYVAAWDHWIAFGLLVAVGGKMLWEARKPREGEQPARDGALLYLALALATSIDAAAAGITLPLLGVAPAIALALIGGVTAVLTAAGYVAGNVLGRRVGSSLEVVGGLVLIAIGVKVLVEHL